MERERTKIDTIIHQLLDDERLYRQGKIEKEGFMEFIRAMYFMNDFKDVKEDSIEATLLKDIFVKSYPDWIKADPIYPAFQYYETGDVKMDYLTMHTNLDYDFENKYAYGYLMLIDPTNELDKNQYKDLKGYTDLVGYSIHEFMDALEGEDTSKESEEEILKRKGMVISNENRFVIFSEKMYDNLTEQRYFINTKHILLIKVRVPKESITAFFNKDIILSNEYEIFAWGHNAK